MKIFYRYSLNERRLIYGFFALYVIFVVFGTIDCFIEAKPLSSIFYVIMGVVNLLFPCYVLATQNKVVVDSNNGKLRVSDKFFFIKPVIVDIESITQVDIVKSRKKDKIYRLLVRLGDNVFYRVLIKNPNDLTEELSKINSNIKIQEVFGAPI